MQPISNNIPTYAQLITGMNDNGGSYRVQRVPGTPDYLLILSLAGHGIFRAGGPSTLLAPGTLAIIPPGTAHDYATAPDCGSWQILWVHMQPWPHWSPLLKYPRLPSDIYLLDLAKLGNLAAVSATLQEMHHLAISGNAYRTLLAMNALERALLSCAQAAALGEPAARDSRITAACEYVAEHLDSTLTIPHLAKIAGLSASRFAHLFREQMSCPPLAYLDQLRMERARDLLACTARPIAEIAREVGYPDPFYFSRRFKRATSVSPRDYRSRAWRRGATD